MGSGKRQVCCCDSITWCDFIKWAYIICGMVFLLSIALLAYRREEAKDAASKISSSNYQNYPSSSHYFSTSYSPSGSGGGGGSPMDNAAAEADKQFYYVITKSGISGVFCIVMGALVWFGASSRSSMCLLCYIIIQLVFTTLSIVSLLGGLIMYQNSTGTADLTAFPAVFFAALFVWVVDIQRKEFDLENPQLPMYQQQPQEMQQWQSQGPGPYPGPEQSQEQEQSDSDQPSQKQHHKKHHHGKKEPLEASSSSAV